MMKRGYDRTYMFYKMLHRGNAFMLRIAGGGQLDFCNLDLVVALHAREIKVLHLDHAVARHHAGFGSELGTRSTSDSRARNPIDAGGCRSFCGVL